MAYSKEESAMMADNSRGMAQTKAPANESAFEHIENIEKAIHGVRDRVSVLEQKLGGILTPTEPRVEGESKKAERSASPLVERMRQLADLLQGIDNSLFDITSRVEL